MKPNIRAWMRAILAVVVMGGVLMFWRNWRVFSAARATEAQAVAKTRKPVNQALVTADNQFGLDLLAKLTAGEKPRNVFLSPVGIATALQLAGSGARGETADAIARTLRLNGMDWDAVDAGAGDLMRAVQTTDPKCKVTVANAVWTDTSEVLRRDYVERARSHYEAQARALDFATPMAADTINRWVSDKTAGNIPRIVSAGDTVRAKVILTNAVYFHGAWTDPFDPKKTRPAPFTLTGGEKVMVPMMGRSGEIWRADVDGVQVIGLPYGEGNLRCVIAMPAEGRALSDLIPTLTPALWVTWTARLVHSSDGVSLPKFQAHYENDLVPTLDAMGLKPATVPGADFSRMADHDLFISKIQHAARLDVDEQGTTAAAATAVFGSLAMVYHKPLIVDRPFLIAIQDTRSGAILFLGAIEDPR